jgi:hypothetical protein
MWIAVHLCSYQSFVAIVTHPFTQPIGESTTFLRCIDGSVVNVLHDLLMVQALIIPRCFDGRHIAGSSLLPDSLISRSLILDPLPVTNRRYQFLGFVRTVLGASVNLEDHQFVSTTTCVVRENASWPTCSSSANSEI